MASTRTRNTIGDYNLQQSINTHIQTYALYKNGSSGAPHIENMPGDGLGNVGIRGYRQADNQVDIESFLRGTGTADLVNGKYWVITPELRTVPTLNVFNKDRVIAPSIHLPPAFDRPWPI
jgi:hypothetical protein